MSWLGQLADWVRRVLLPYGAWGLAPAAVLDSSFLSLAGGVDLWLISLCVNEPARAPLFVLVATLGSVAGANALYFAARKGEEAIVEKLPVARRLAQVRARVERYGAWAMMVAALLPPPAPLKLFIAAAGLLPLRWKHFTLGMLAGRTIRYSLEAMLAVYLGRQAWETLLALGPWTIGAIALVLALLIVVLKLRGRTVSAS